MPAAASPYGIDLTDIPAVSRRSVRDALCLLTISNIGIDPPRALSDAQHAAFVEAFWRRHEGAGAEGLALLYRLTAMLRLLPARPLEPLFRARPELVLAAAADVSAALRLNPKWGFNRMRFIADVCSRLREIDVRARERARQFERTRADLLDVREAA